MSSENGGTVFNRRSFTESRCFVNGNSHTAEALSLGLCRLRQTTQTAVQNLDRGEFDLRLLQQLYSTILGLVSRANAVDVAVEGNLTTNRQSTLASKSQQPIAVREGISNGFAVLRTGGVDGHTEELTVRTGDNLRGDDTTGHRQGVERGILSLCQEKESRTCVI